MSILEFLTEVAEGIASFLPNMAKSLYNTFTALFWVPSNVVGGAVEYGLSALAIVSIAFFIVAMGRRFIPTVASWLKASIRRRKRSRRKR